MISHTENLNDSIKYLLGIIKQFRKVVRGKINIQKSVAFLHQWQTICSSVSHLLLFILSSQRYILFCWYGFKWLILEESHTVHKINFTNMNFGASFLKNYLFSSYFKARERQDVPSTGSLSPKDCNSQGQVRLKPGASSTQASLVGDIH